ncbi:MAG: hypothetical protein CSA35_01055 [Dethiosulfovibrio peptidovorans]|nr:MAG: hypothetical protein CSA35_01055 [Dethiosulfovibrio peptidovorans]
MSVQIRDFLLSLEPFASLDWAEDWDNGGVSVRSRSGEIHRVAVALDPTVEAVRQAADQGCDCLLTHHPLIFSPLRFLDPELPTAAALYELVERGMTAVSCHTSWDNSPVGTNVSLVQACTQNSPRPLLLGKGWGTGAVVSFQSSSPLAVAEMLKDRWGLTWARVYGASRSVSSMALCGGSGGELWREALNTGADLYVTADMKYHDLQDAVLSGLAVIVVDHGEMEWASMDSLRGCVRQATGLDVILLEKPDMGGCVL